MSLKYGEIINEIAAGITISGMKRTNLTSWK
jgi:hypothetical protein